MTDNIITPEFRITWNGLFRATAPKDDPNGKKKFSVRAAFPPDTDLSAMNAEAALAAQERWGDKKPSTLRSPFRTNAELDSPIDGIGPDWIIMTFSANEDRRPGVVDQNLQEIMDDSKVYSGAWGRAQVRAFGFDQRGNKGVSFGLQNFMKTRDDKPIGSGKMPASKAFEGFKAAGAKQSTADIFG